MFWAAVAGGYLALIGLVMALGRAVKRADAFDEACFEESQRRRKNRAPGWKAAIRPGGGGGAISPDPTRTGVTPDPPSFAWRGGALLSALVIATLSLLPPERLPAWTPDLDRGIGGTAAWLAAGAGLLALAALALRSAPAGGRLKVAPGLRLSRPLSLALVVYVLGLALIASEGLRAAAWDIALARAPAWVDLAAERLTAAHTLAYAGLGALTALGWGRRGDLWRAGLLALALSGVLELLQGAVPGRSPNGWDLLANGLGVAAGLAAGRLLTARPWTAPAPGAHGRQHRRRHYRRTTPGPTMEKLDTAASSTRSPRRAWTAPPRA